LELGLGSCKEESQTTGESEIVMGEIDCTAFANPIDHKQTSGKKHMVTLRLIAPPSPTRSIINKHQEKSTWLRYLRTPPFGWDLPITSKR
jgi:hypothetical protein